MSAFRDAFQRLGSASAISWPVFWITLPFNLLMSLISGFDAQVDVWTRITAPLISQVCIFGFLFFVRFTALERIAPHWRPSATLLSFAIAGALRGVIVSAIYMALGPSGPELLVPRIPAGIIFGLVVIAPVALAVATMRSYRTVRQELLTQQQQLEQARSTAIKAIEDRGSEAISEVRTAFLDAMDADTEIDRTADQLTSLTNSVVRPLSHALASGVASWQPTPPSQQVAIVRLRDVVERVSSGKPFLPWTTAILISALSVTWIFLEEGAAATLLYVVAGGLTFAAGLWLANLVLAQVLPGRKLPIRITLIVVGAVFAGAALGITATLVAGSTPWVTPLWVAGLIFLPLFALLLALARAVEFELQRSLADLREVDNALAWQVARLQQVQWIRQRTTARALHGPVQAIVASGVMQLRRAPTQQQVAVLEALRSSLVETLDIASDSKDHVSWEEGLARINATWQGVCSVKVSTEDKSDQVLKDDPIAAEVALEIVAEAVSNAVRHGKARNIVVMVTCAHICVTIVVTDDGLMEPDAPFASTRTGLGSTMMSDCSVAWSRIRSEGLTRTEVTLPVQGLAHE